MSDPKASRPEPKAHVAVLMDLESLARAGGTPPPATLAAALLRYAAGVGRVMMARAYADFGPRVDDANALQAARVLPSHRTRGPAGSWARSARATTRPGTGRPPGSRGRAGTR